jgi:hypothetical protein
MIAFLDIEASSLSPHSVPIEIAWVLEDGTSESHLIQPQPTWHDWAADSALVHGITRAMLVAEGSPAADVARRLHAALDGHDLHSDAPEADQIWLTVLMQTASLPTPPVLHVYDALRPSSARSSNACRDRTRNRWRNPLLCAQKKTPSARVVSGIAPSRIRGGCMGFGWRCRNRWPRCSTAGRSEMRRLPGGGR